MAQDMLLDHAANLIDPGLGKQIPADGVLGRKANFKAVQRMQAVNYAIAANYCSYATSPEFRQQKKEYIRQLKDPDPDVRARANSGLDQMCNNAPLCRVYGALGGENGVQEILNRTTLNPRDTFAMSEEKEIRTPIETILRQAALTEKMGAIEDLLEKGGVPEAQRVEEFSVGLQNRQIQAGGMQI